MSKGLVFVLVLVFLMSITILPPATAKAQTKTLVVPDQYRTIQDAIGNASAGDTVFVRSGTYNQSITISKSINLIAENAQTTILTMPQRYSHPVGWFTPETDVINITANNVSISNFTILNPNIAGGVAVDSNGDGNQITSIYVSSNATKTGILVNGTHQYISQNYIANAENGIQCNGSYNQIIGNTFPSQVTGIYLSGAYNRVMGNSIASVSGACVSLYYANSSLIEKNVIKGGLYVWGSNSNIIYNNTIEEGGGLMLGYAKNLPASNNLVEANTIEGAGVPIQFDCGSNNEIYGNLIANSLVYGLTLGGIDQGVDNNLIHYNMFINNSGGNFGANWQVIGNYSFDYGSVGNYWDDYLTKYPNATEVDNSGIGNTPYIVYNNVTDNYPLMKPFDISSITVQLPSWINSLPSLRTTPTFPPQNTQPTPTPTVPEFPASTISVLLIVTLVSSLLVYFKKRKR